MKKHYPDTFHKIRSAASLLIALLLLSSTYAKAQSSKSIYRVAAQGDEKIKSDTEGTNDGSSWDKPITLEQALERAKAGDEIWVKGYKQLSTELLYTTPDEFGFQLKSGVTLKGGYIGDSANDKARSTKGQSKYDYTYQSALVGDINANDSVPADQLIFQGNETRTDNAIHVLNVDLSIDENTTNSSSAATVIDGFTIAAGHAYAVNANSEEAHGGGIFVHNDSQDNNAGKRAFKIKECFFVNNYASRGGAIYIDKNVTNSASTIEYCGFYNNVSGTRGSNENSGGGIWMGGAGVIHNCAILNNVNGGVCLSENAKVVNSTIVHNTVAGADLISAKSTTGQADSEGSLYNTVIWGNSTLSKHTPHPNFYNCAYPEVEVDNLGDTDGNGNLKISYNNFSTEPSVWFTIPTAQVGYDRSFNTMASVIPSYSLDLDEQSALLGKGNYSYYKNFVGESYNEDLSGEARYENEDGSNSIDIGAYERVRLGVNRHLYVKQGGTGKGTSWDDAMGDLQVAIDQLANDANNQGKKGEVWVAAGIYTPQKRITGNNSNVPLSFRMRDGISVIGGFAGTEKSASERIRTRVNQNYWDYQNKTILQGAREGNKQDEIAGEWNEASREWTVSSQSTHVVWFAPLPGKEEFKLSTILDGCTIQGGSSNQAGSESESYQPNYGAGVYMASANAQLRGCIVRYNNAGMKASSEASKNNPRGGGVYCKNGKITYTLVYNNSAYEGGGIYLEDVGQIKNSMANNNSAVVGAGVYMSKDKDTEAANSQLVLATSIVCNNTSTLNGAVYVASPALVEQNTIVNNYTANVTDASASNTSYTGGLYITEGCTAVNNIIGNNSLLEQSSNKSSASLAQVYNERGTKQTVRFYNNAISDINAATWNKIYQSNTVALSFDKLNNIFEPYEDSSNFDEFKTLRGVQSYWTAINYFWPLCKGSLLRTKGALYAQLPADVFYKPSTDFMERNIESCPPIGAYTADSQDFVFEKNGNRLRLYFNPSNTSPDGDGSSWEKEYPSLNEIFSYLNTLKAGSQVKILNGTGTGSSTTTLNATSSYTFEICCREGTMEPNTPYTFQESEEHAKTYNVLATAYPVTILGGYPTKETTPTPTDDDRKPYKYRTEFTGNADGDALSDGLFHVFRIEDGANITLDGIAITKGYASGMASTTRGGGILIGSDTSTDNGTTTTRVTLKDCILENNTAIDGSAIAANNSAKNIKLTLINSVINNNSSIQESTQVERANVIKTANEIIDMGNDNANNTLTLNHVSIINNIGKAPETIGNSSFAAGNYVYTYNTDGTQEETLANAHNNQSMQTLDKEGAANFSNPTIHAGARLNSNVYLGGNAEFRPLTSSTENDGIINTAVDDTETAALDINGEERELGGASDLGAYEALLPKAGKVIYVRSYNQYYPKDNKSEDEIDGNPDFSLLSNNPGKVYDGKTWSRAIMGNAICDVTKERKDNDFYIVENGMLQAATIDNADYSGDGNGTATNPSTAKYGQTSNAYGAFFGSNTGNKTNQNVPNSNEKYNLITNNRYERYISGLQYAIEQAALLNQNLQSGEDSVVVWVGGGVYTDYKGFVIRNGVKVYGGFKNSGNPSEEDRHPLLSQYVPARKDYEGLNKADYETILQVRKESPVYLSSSSKELWWGDKLTDGSTNKFADDLIQATKTTRHYVLYQPDVCLPTWGTSGDAANSKVSSNEYRYKGSKFADDQYYQEYTRGQVKWDGFTIRHGYITHYEANRDGGGGVRVFRGIELENLIIVNNLSHGRRSRGGGLYMDGDNSVISNSYLVRNLCWGTKDNYGGGAYMIQGTGYNMVVSNNRSYSQGGGIFIESAKFYNNTVAYNMSNQAQGTGIMHWQDNTTGITSSLTLYNCIVYNNIQKNTAKSIGNVGTSAYNKLNYAHNCYVNSKDLSGKFRKEDGNIVGDADELADPFALKGYEDNKTGICFAKARLQNDYRLDESNGLNNKCLNGGTEDMPNMPSTDMDYTNRIKDCTIDIGAYEADNITNITPQTVKNVEGATGREDVDDYVYYVTQNGYGNRSGDSPENAACADKLQNVLTAAGDYANTKNATITDNNKKHKVYVKVAGYDADADGVRFIYHANTLADKDDPQSYTFLIPDGVWLMGGYNEGTYDSETGKMKDANWNDNKRDVQTHYQTILSAKTEPKLGSAVEQEVNGYHTVTFGAWPKTADVQAYNLSAVSYRATIDGVHLIDGQAVDNAGFKGMGGAAIVPKNAHVRNCIIEGNEALNGGGLCLLPGGMVTGSLLRNNKAKKGGAIYAVTHDPLKGSELDYHAYAISCTIADNEATEGGGIYQELGALMGGNLVVWGNTATTEQNISGVTNEQFLDAMMDASHGTRYYPYNDCFVEKYLLPANTRNSEMTSDAETFFTDTETFRPRAYSPLVGQGVTTAYYTAWIQQAGILSYDILGNEQNTITNERITAGCYAMDALVRDTTTLITRLFVSADGGANVSDAVKRQYLGRSFKTPFNNLDAALDYIRKVRKTKKKNSSEFLATDKTKFEIFMTGGTYRPSVMRSGEYATEARPRDRRLNSFVIPQNVSIYGGFSSDDKYSSNLWYQDATSFESLTQIVDNGTVIVDNLIPDVDEDGNALEDGKIVKILETRNNEAHMVDLNNNGLIEPWEFRNQTIFSGDIKASENEKNVYHVVFSRIKDTQESSAEKNNDVLLDGIVIMNGETYEDIAYTDASKKEEDLENELGHGGGIYSENVSYTLNRCRILNNIAVHGGGIYVQDGSVDLINTYVGGNWAGSESNRTDLGSGHGGGVCVYFTSADKGNFHAVNSIFVNNEAMQHGTDDKARGGAIFIRRAPNYKTYKKENGTTYYDVNIMNCIIAKNKATEDAAVRLEEAPNTEASSNSSTPNALFNTVIWSNEESSNNLSSADMDHCAADKLNATSARDEKKNVKLDAVNMAATGPRFTEPTSEVGKAGFNMLAKWNPAAISVLTDAGNGTLGANITDFRQGTGAYFNWWKLHDPRLYNCNYDNNENYVAKATASQSSGLNRGTNTEYSRYKGPRNDNGTYADKVIDIGMYEFQYQFTFSDNNAVYIGTEGKGDESGKDWANQSTDLRGAIIAMANPTGNKPDDAAEDWPKRKIYVRGGEYYSPSLNANDAFSLNVATNSELITSLEIIGSCTGDGATQNFSKPTILVPNEELESKENRVTKQLLNIATNGKPVTISGITLKNTSSVNESNERVGLHALINSGDNAGKLTLKNCAFRENTSHGASIEGNNNTGKAAGELLIYNTLFADGKSDGLNIASTNAANLTATITNATFAQNKGYDMVANGANMNVYNTVSWNNGNSILGTTTVPAETAQDKEPSATTNYNKWFVSGQQNEDILQGPNFTNPANGDYTLRPSLMLLNKGSNSLYAQAVWSKDATSEVTATDFDGEKDLNNLARLTGDAIDVGAYECNSILQPIIYVKKQETAGTGMSWTSPANNLENAINLAELYANTNQASPYGYVFVDRDFEQNDVRINLPGIKLYGSMSGEYQALPESASRKDIENTVKAVLAQRKGIIEQNTITTLNGLTLNFENGTRQNGTTAESITSVVDGFMVNGEVKMNNGYLATSILNEGATLTGTTSTETSGTTTLPTLYNSLILGNVKGAAKAINVTAIGNLPANSDNANNRTSVTEKNRYVEDNYWSYQLNETSSDIDATNSKNEETVTCEQVVGHDHDLAGNLRIRNDKVDNGCFETWKLLTTTKAYADDYPHGKSVVYVTTEGTGTQPDPTTNAAFHELRLDPAFYTKANQFTPGFLLLQHHAGLRGNGSYISLNNFAIERKFIVDENAEEKIARQLSVIPFEYYKREVYDNNGNSTRDQGYEMKLYDGEKRAAYDYKFQTLEEKSAWTLKDGSSLSDVTQGLMVSSERSQTLRAYGNSYEESPTLSTVKLKQYNYNQEWTSASGSTKFTAKENMGWNLFGSPYLCAMNYQDMEYGRMIYPFNVDTQNFSSPVNTDTDVEGGVSDGYIPALDAVFTQTATLSDIQTEEFKVKHSSDLSGKAYQHSIENLSVQLAKSTSRSTENSRSAATGKNTEASDQITLNAVASQKANKDFELGMDGVKWMTSTNPQLYMERNGGRYSLLSAVSIEGSLNIGVSVPEAGEYSLSIPEECETSKYETVWLKDKQTGKGMNLLDGSYCFDATEAGEMNDRFVISFNRMAEDIASQAISIASRGRGNIILSGVQADDHIAVYAASGTEVASKIASSTDESLQVAVSGTVIVEVTRDGKQVAVKKLAVR